MVRAAGCLSLTRSPLPLGRRNATQVRLSPVGLGTWVDKGPAEKGEQVDGTSPGQLRAARSPLGAPRLSQGTEGLGWESGLRWEECARAQPPPEPRGDVSKTMSVPAQEKHRGRRQGGRRLKGAPHSPVARRGPHRWHQLAAQPVTWEAPLHPREASPVGMRGGPRGTGRTSGPRWHWRGRPSGPSSGSWKGRWQTMVDTVPPHRARPGH